MKRIGAIILCLVLVLSLCACEQKEENPLTGTWQGRWSDSEEMSIGLEFKVNADSTFVMTIDAGDLLDKLDEITQAMEQAGQSAQEGLDRVLEKVGLDSQTLQKVLDWIFPKDSDSEDGQRKRTAEIQGRCKVEDGKLYISLVKAVGIYGDTYLLYTLEGDSLTLSLPEDASEIGQMLSFVLPVTLQKAQ